MTDQVTDKTKIPEHEAIYQRLNEMVLFGDLKPGEPVTINGLKDKLNAGMTPIREAIRRLMAQGALSSTGTRRVVVPKMTLDRLQQVRFVRDQIEPQLASLAAQNIDKSAIRKLRKLDDAVNEAIELGDVGQYLSSNYHFHFYLYQFAENDILCDIVHSLWMKVGPALRVVNGKIGTANLPDMHDEALLALERSDCDAVGLAIGADIAQGMNQVEHALKQGR